MGIKKSKLITVFSLIVALVLIVMISKKIDEKNKAYYFSTLDLNLKGKVLSVVIPPSSNGCGIINMQIISSNMDNYDPRKKFDYYYCLIKDSIAQVYQLGASFCSPGDIVEINTRTKRISVESKIRGNESWTIVLYTNASFYKLVEKKYQQYFN